MIPQLLVNIATGFRGNSAHRLIDPCRSFERRQREFATQQDTAETSSCTSKRDAWFWSARTHYRARDCYCCAALAFTIDAAQQIDLVSRLTERHRKPLCSRVGAAVTRCHDDGSTSHGGIVSRRRKANLRKATVPRERRSGAHRSRNSL